MAATGETGTYVTIVKEGTDATGGKGETYEAVAEEDTYLFIVIGETCSSKGERGDMCSNGKWGVLCR